MALLDRHPALPSNAQLAALLDHSEQALLLFDSRQRVAFANRAARTAFGAAPGQRRDEALAALDAAARERVVAALDETGDAGPVEALLAGGSAWRATTATVAGGQRLLVLGPLPAAPPLDPDATGAAVRLLWDTPQPLTLRDTAARLVAANRAFCRQAGRPADELIGREYGSLFAPGGSSAAAADEEALAALHAGCQPAHEVERVLIDAAGRARRLRSAPRWVSAADGAPLLLEVMQDVTSEHPAHGEEAPPDGDFVQWFDRSPVAMLVYERNGRIVRSNAALHALIGALPARLPDAPPDLARLLGWEGEAVHPDLGPGASARELRLSLTAPGGRRLHARLSPQGEGDAPRVLAIVEDRSLEDERDLARLEIGALMDTAGIGVATYEASRGWVIGQPARAAAGADGPALHPSLRSIGREQVEPASLPDFARLQAALREGARAQVRYAVRVSGLGVRWLLTRVEPGELAGGRAALSVVTLDVTEQEEAHRRNEQLLRELTTILDGTSAGIAFVRGEQLVRCNRRFRAMLDLREDSAAQPLSAALAGQPEVLALLRRALAEDGRFEIELPIDGAWYALAAARAAGGGEPEVVAVLTDVSRLKAQQAELEAIARERELMFSLSEVGIAHLRGGRIVRANAALARLVGTPVEALAGASLDALFDGPVRGGERRLKRADGGTSWVQFAERSVDETQLQAGTICTCVDIDERQRVRDALQLQADRTRAILDSVLVGIVTVADGRIAWMNRSARRMAGGELADFVGEPIAVIATPEPGHPLRATHYLDALADGQAETFECRLRARDGREFWVVGNAVVTGRESTGRQITFALLDIERRRQAEVSIAQTQASLQRIIDTAPLAIALFDAPSGRVLRLNQPAAALFGRREDELVGRAPEEWADAVQASALRAEFAQARVRGEVQRREFAQPAADGAPPRVWDLRIVALDAGGQPQLLLVASDVSEQRAAEQARYEAAVAQRELLIKEVHHRIKNNLQGVAGLLQQTAARRPEVATVIAEAVAQVHAIAQVHGLQVGLAGPLPIAPLLGAIATSVQRMFGRPIAVRIEGGGAALCALPEAEAIPVALTVNELLTNAVKHGAAGAIECALRRGTGEAAIVVRSPGQLRAGFSLSQVAPGVSGLGLVRALLPRRSATLALTEDGAAVEAKVVLVPPSVELPA